mmetsp:Transcript_11045/g.23448  ORF Transcript_11045/g.23448 Transcript_11045/m.23448 type:complete len:211 (-) Transcript_11045:271-903(-)
MSIEGLGMMNDGCSFTSLLLLLLSLLSLHLLTLLKRLAQPFLLIPHALQLHLDRSTLLLALIRPNLLLRQRLRTQTLLVPILALPKRLAQPRRFLLHAPRAYVALVPYRATRRMISFEDARFGNDAVAGADGLDLLLFEGIAVHPGGEGFDGCDFGVGRLDVALFDAWFGVKTQRRRGSGGVVVVVVVVSAFCLWNVCFSSSSPSSLLRA